MIRFTLAHIKHNYVLMVWPALVILFVIAAAIWGTIEPKGAYDFELLFGNHFPLDSAQTGLHMMSFVVLNLMIGLPIHLAENLKKERAAIILTKPISRIEFFLGDIAAVFIIMLIYAAISIVAIATYTMLFAGIMPVSLILAMLCYPLLAFMYYATINLVLMISRSSLMAVFLVFIIGPLSSILFMADKTFPAFGIQSELIIQIGDMLGYVIPSAGAVTILYSFLLKGASDLSLIADAFTLKMMVQLFTSALPFLGLSYYLFRRKEF
ncbi:MAG: hypothetical protein FH748_16460 [Balneolaceae bacterium]|nr:hypothetical protein [Balneolaceae bacterium]